MMILQFLFILFFLFLIGSQIFLATEEGFGNQSDLDKLDKKMDSVKADVFDLSLNVTALQKNVATLMNQQAGYASSLKNSAMDIPADVPS
jgi:hypothetical protein